MTIAMALMVALAMPAWAGIGEGYDAYVRGDYVAAFREWLPVAEAGSAEAQFNIAVMFQKGRGVPADSAEALRCGTAAPPGKATPTRRTTWAAC